MVRPGEIPVLNALLRHSFTMSQEETARYIGRIGEDGMRIVHSEHQLASAAGLIRMGMYFGGRSVPCVGIAGVATAPEFRGHGVATRLMRELVRELAEARVALSALFPATMELYRKAGYGLGGSRVVWEIDPKDIGVEFRAHDMVPADREDEPEFRRLYALHAAGASGHLDRADYQWKRIFDPPTPENRYWIVRGPDSNVGYVALRLSRTPDNSAHNIEVVDVVALNRQAAQRILTFLADYGTIHRKVMWQGGPVDPLAALLPENRTRVQTHESWFLRMVDVEEALRQRGYPRTLEAELHLEVQDDLVKRNNDRFILNVADGRCVVRRGGRAHLRLDVRDLSAIYSRALSPLELGRTSTVAATDHALEIAALVFSGPSPWMADRF
jgi:predicted acetyltransferase